MGQHAILAPSGADTWMTCMGSVAMQRGLEDEANNYTDEGTAAHLLGSACLENGVEPATFKGDKIAVGYRAEDEFDGAVWVPNPADGGDGPPEYALMKVRRVYTVDDEMIEAVGRYVNTVREYAAGALLLLPERRIFIGQFTGEEGAHGTSDAAVVLPDELQVHDLKYGMGVRVDAKRNRQLMIYALGVRDELDLTYGPFKRIRFVIHQPRLGPPSEWDCTPEELDAFAAEVQFKAHKVMALREVPREQISYDDLNPSEDACRWCKAKATCHGLAKYVAETAAVDFEAEDSAPVTPDKSTPVEVLARNMAAIPLIEDWCRATRGEVERRVLGGESVPGWKIVQGKRGSRQWKDEDAVTELLVKMRMPVEERCNLKLKTPPQIEKVLKSSPRRWKRVLDSELIIQPDGKPSVAPESDPRPVWAPPDPANDFTATEEHAA